MARFFLSATALATLCLTLVAAKPMGRLQATTRQAQGTGSGILSAAAGAASAAANAAGAATTATVTAGEMLPAAKPDPEVEQIRDAMRNGLDVMKVFSDNLNVDTPAMKVLLGNTEIQQRIVKEIPVIKAFAGFKEIVTGQSADETRTNFVAGVKAILEAMPDALKTMKDPTISTQKLSQLLQSGDDEFKAAFSLAEGGDPAAMELVSDKLNSELYPMFNTAVFKEIAASKPLEKLANNQEIMRIISEDPVMEAAIKTPDQLDKVARKVASRRRFV